MISWMPSDPWRDPVTEAYRKDIDRTLLRDNLTRSVDERFARLMELQRFAEELANYQLLVTANPGARLFLRRGGPLDRRGVNRAGIGGGFHEFAEFGLRLEQRFEGLGLLEHDVVPGVGHDVGVAATQLLGGCVERFGFNSHHV